MPGPQSDAECYDNDDDDDDDDFDDDYDYIADDPLACQDLSLTELACAPQVSPTASYQEIIQVIRRLGG